MPIITLNRLDTAQKVYIRQLWNSNFPAQLAHSTLADFEAFLTRDPQRQHYLILNTEGAIAGWMMVFDRKGEPWFSIIVDEREQGQRIGSRLLEHAKTRHEALNGWVVDHNDDFLSDGRPYQSPIAFYLKNGFVTVPHIRSQDLKISCVKIHWHHGQDVS